MLSKKLEEAVNKQINAEIWSGYLYLSMALNFAERGYDGFTNWFNIQAREEMEHAMILMNYMVSRGNKVALAPIDKVETNWDTQETAFQDTLNHEKVVTSMIHNLYGIAHDERDFASVSALTWFVDEQVEEEETAQSILDVLKRIKNDEAGLYMLDRELAARIYSQASPLMGKIIG